MKKILLLAAVLLTITTNAFAFQVNFQASMNANRTHAEARIYNNFNRPIICTGEAFAVTNYGNNLNSWMRDVVINPGQFSYVNFYTRGYEYLYRVNGSAFCNFL